MNYLNVTLSRKVRISIGLKVISHTEGSSNVFSRGFSSVETDAASSHFRAYNKNIQKL